MKFFWNHDKSFQHFIESAAFAPLDAEICKYWFSASASAFWDGNPLFSETMQNKASWLPWITMNEWMNNTKNALKTHALTRAFFLHRTRKMCEDLACALTIYIWAVLYIPTITLMSVNNYLPRGLLNLGRGTKPKVLLQDLRACFSRISISFSRWN